MGMAKEAADAASQAKDSDELFGRLKITLAQNSAAASIFDTLRDRLSFQGAYWAEWLCMCCRSSLSFIHLFIFCLVLLCEKIDLSVYTCP